MTSGDLPKTRYAAAVGLTGGGDVGLSSSSSNGNANGSINGGVIGNGNGNANGNINGSVAGNVIGNDSGSINRNAVENGNGIVTSNANGLDSGAVPESAVRQSVLEAACEVNGAGKGPREEERLLQNVAAPMDTAAALSVAAADGNSTPSVFEPPGFIVSGAEKGDLTAKVAVGIVEKQVLPPASLAEVRVRGTLHGKGVDR